MKPAARDESAPNPTASRRLTAALVRAILQGEYPAGARLPTERTLAVRHAVSRHVVREALKRLEALGLVRIQQGSGVYVQDVLLTGGMELLEYLLFNEQGLFDRRVFDDLFSFWTRFVPDVLRLAARQRTAEQMTILRQALAERTEALSDIARLTRIHLRMLRTIAQAAHNTIYQLIFNNMGRVIARLRAAVPLEHFGPVLPQEELAHVVAALEQQDEELAALLAQRLSERTKAVVDAFIDSLIAAGRADSLIAQV